MFGCFNSIVVRLRPHYQKHRPASWRSFNSIVVRLRPLLPFVACHILQVFQFYSSSIKTFRGIYPKAPIDSFNSIVVRLRQTILILVKELKKSFNSIVVRLRRWFGF